MNTAGELGLSIGSPIMFVLLIALISVYFVTIYKWMFKGENPTPVSWEGEVVHWSDSPILIGFADLDNFFYRWIWLLYIAGLSMSLTLWFMACAILHIPFVIIYLIGAMFYYIYQAIRRCCINLLDVAILERRERQLEITPPSYPKV